MVLTSILLAIQLRLDLTAVLLARRGHPLTAPVATCGIKVVGFRFEGVEGQRFDLAGKTYTIGHEGFIELLSDGETTYSYAGRTLPLDVWPLDAFSLRVVPLPKGNAGGGK